MVIKYKVHWEGDDLIFEKMTYPKLIATVECKKPMTIIKNFQFFEDCSASDVKDSIAEIGHYIEIICKRRKSS
jgi:hypothetical protein